MDEFVIQDRNGKLKFRLFFAAIFHADDAALAENFAVLLSRDRFWHLKYHFHQSIFGKALLTAYEHARLAQVLDNALIPCSQIFHAIPKRSLHLNPARARYPAGG